MNYIIVDGPGAPIVPNPNLSLYEFRTRFTLAEKVAIEEAAETDVAIRVVMKDFDTATVIDLTGSHVLDNLMVLVDKMLLTEERVEEITTP